MRTHTEVCRLVNSTSIIAWSKHSAITKPRRSPHRFYLSLHCLIKQTNKRTRTLRWRLVLSNITPLRKFSNQSHINYNSSRLFPFTVEVTCNFSTTTSQQIALGFLKVAVCSRRSSKKFQDFFWLKVLNICKDT